MWILAILVGVRYSTEQKQLPRSNQDSRTLTNLCFSLVAEQFLASYNFADPA